MRLPLRDALATLLVLASLLVFAAREMGMPLPGFGEVSAVAVAVLALGIAASMSAVVPGFAALLHGSRLYLVTASVLGLVALGAGLWAVFGGEAAALGALIAATVALWTMSTLRHVAVNRPQQRIIHR
jgi:hypothetical protein